MPLTNYRISQEYGRKNSTYRKGYHSGIDIVAIGDIGVYSVGQGQVVQARFAPGKGADPNGWGNYVIVRQTDGRDVLYAHLSQVLVADWQSIKKGHKVGVQGSTGNSTGAHLHFEVWQGLWTNRNDINPADYLGIENKVGPKTAKAVSPVEVKVVAGNKIYTGRLIEGKTYVHVRVLEEFGLPVYWEGSTKTVYIGNRVSTIDNFGNYVKVVAGDKVYSGQLIESKTYVHVRVLEEFGLFVHWEDATRTVYVGDRLPRLEKFGTYDVITIRANQLKVCLVKGHLQQDGINGGYLDGNLNPLGITIIDGKTISDRIASKPPRSVFAIDKHGKAYILSSVAKASGLDALYALGAGPSLLPVLDEGFQDDITKSVRERSAVGITQDGLVKLVATEPMTLSKLAGVMINIGCIKAMNLDGGGSSHMRFGGKTIRGGGRATSTAITII